MGFVVFPNWLADIQIEYVPVSAVLENATARGVLWQTAPNRFLLDLPGVGRFLAERGCRLAVEVVTPADEDQVARFVRTTPLAALLYQRGILAFHAAAAALPGVGAILLAGDSSAGKSALLAALLLHGWQMLSDDLAVVALDEAGKPIVLPVHSEILLWEDSLENLGKSNLPGSKTLANGKRAFSAQDHFIESPLVLRSIYWLTVRHDRGIETEQIRGQEFFQAISKLLYNSHIADALLDRRSYFRLASTITQSIMLLRLNRPGRKWSVKELAGVIEADLLKK